MRQVFVVVGVLLPLLTNAQGGIAPKKLTTKITGHAVVTDPRNDKLLRYQNGVVAGTRVFRRGSNVTVWQYRGAFEFKLPSDVPVNRLASARLEIPETGNPGACKDAHFALSSFDGNCTWDANDVENGNVVTTVSITSADKRTFPAPIDVTAVVRAALQDFSKPWPFASNGFIGFNVRQTNEENCMRYYDSRFIVLILEVAPEPIGPIGGVGIRG